MFKIEEDDDHNKLDNVMFYGISAKRYCLYDSSNGKIRIRKYSTHGLGHLLNIEGEQVWKSILTKDFKEYSDRIAVSQITITKPSILSRFEKMNSGKQYAKQIKPFNFMLIGSEINQVIPCLPFDKDISGIEYRSFIDYKSDLISDALPLPSTAYWHTLEDVLTQYVRHNDNKFDYVDGIAHRQHIIADRIRYIGKETNNLDETNITGLNEDSYLEYDNVMEFHDWVLNLKPKDVRDKRISERGLRNVKWKIKQGKGLKNRSKIIGILFKKYWIRTIKILGLRY